jgi:hypothetical protein
MQTSKERTQARLHLKLWRTIKKDTTLKQAPSYKTLCGVRGVRITLKSPRERATLEALSRARNLLNPKAVMDISQSISRVNLRMDGLVPTLTSTCGSIFIPSTATKLDSNLCLALQGFDLSRLDLNGISPEQACSMAGNAMSVPVVGAALWAVICQLSPP